MHQHQFLMFADTSSFDGVLSTLLAIFAFLISIYSLWASHLKPFRPFFLLRGPTLRFVQFKRQVSNEEKSLTVAVWDPIVDFSITVFNSGVQPGQILDFRLVFSSEELTWAAYPDYTADLENWRGFFAKRSTIKNPGEIYKHTHKTKWSGLLIRKEETLSELIVFTTNILGFREIPRGTYVVTLEYCTPSSKQWVTIRQFDFCLDEWMKSLLENGDAFTLGITSGDRVRPNTWKDSRAIIVDDEIENELERPPQK